MRKCYAYHKPSDSGISIIQELREAYSALHERIEMLCPPSRERAVALTNLEESAMWSIKSVVCNDPQSETMIPRPEVPMPNGGHPAA